MFAASRFYWTRTLCITLLEGRRTHRTYETMIPPSPRPYFLLLQSSAISMTNERKLCPGSRLPPTDSVPPRPDIVWCVLRWSPMSAWDPLQRSPSTIIFLEYFLFCPRIAMSLVDSKCCLGWLRVWSFDRTALLLRCKKPSPLIRSKSLINGRHLETERKYSEILVRCLAFVQDTLYPNLISIGQCVWS